MVYKQITVVPRRHGWCMRRKDRTISRFHPWLPATDAMEMDDCYNGSWPASGGFPLSHLIQNRTAGPTLPFRKRLFLQEPESRMWHHVIHCGGDYEPEEFSVKLENGALVVSARHERVSPDEGSKDVQEMSRHIKVPDNLDAETIRCVLRDNGDMVIIARRQTEVPNACEAKSRECANKDSDPNNEETVLPKTNTIEEPSEKSLTAMANDSSLSTIDDKASQSFSMDMPISGFKPSEVTVTRRGRRLTMCGEKTEESDHGTTYQKWRRQILLPPNADLERLDCHLAQDGQLRLCAPKSDSEHSNLTKEREVPVVIMGQNNKEDKQCDEMKE